VFDDKGFYSEIGNNVANAAKTLKGKVEGPIQFNAGTSFAQLLPGSYGGLVTVFSGPRDFIKPFLETLRDRKAQTVPVLLGSPDAEALAVMLAPHGQDVLVVALADPRDTPFASRAIANLKAFGAPISVGAIYGYAGVEVWASAVRTAKTFDAGSSAKVLRDTKSESSLGSISFDKNGDARETHFGFYRIPEAGKIARLTSYGGRPPPPPPPPPPPSK